MIDARLEATALLASLEPCMWITPAGMRRFVAKLQAAAALPLQAIGDVMTRPVAVGSDGIARIVMHGEIVPHAMRFEEEFGVVSIERIRAQFRQALADPNVTGILFDVDSPGGFVSGVPDLADEILAARGQKPMVALANENAYSAAYYLAAGADRLVLSRTAGVGSIGVIAVHVDESAMLERLGVKFTAVKAGAKKDQWAWWAPLSDEAKAELQADVDRNMDLFAAHVAKARGLDEATVRGFEAGVFHGEQGVTAGLADRVAPATQALREFTRTKRMDQRSEADEPAQEDKMADKDKEGTVVDLAAERLRLRGEIEAEAATRVTDVREVFAGFTDHAAAMALQAECLADPKVTALEASKRLLKALAESDPHISNAHGGGGHANDQPTRITAAMSAGFYQKRRDAVAKAQRQTA